MDVVVTVPRQYWRAWLGEGDLPGDPATGCQYMFTVPGRPQIEPGERVYVVVGGKLRGYAPLVRVDPALRGKSQLIRADGAVAVTIAQSIAGFRGFRYRWWGRDLEQPFPDWKTL